MEGEEITLRQMLREHMSESSRTQMEIKQSLAKIEVHGEYTQKTLQDHTTRVGHLEDAHNKQKGAMWVLGSGGIIGILHAIKSALGL